ncbi:MAG: gamma-glutamyltransferase [Chloroflexi bacterium]|nr:gamma-glutamyltransferase [Chloroflexota bacterium]
MSGWRSKAGVTFETSKAPATGTRGMVVTNHPLGSAAGVEMLAMGGNAIDAAIAAVFALSVAEPAMVGPFGAGFINLRLASGEFAIVDNYSVAPMAATPTMYRPLSDTWPDYMEVEGAENRIGYRSVAVPGNLMAWCEALQEWGTLPPPAVMAPAIRYAEHGFPASHYLADTIKENAEALARFPASAAVFLPKGVPPKPGERIVRTEYAASLRTIAGQGAAALYDGELGRAIVEDIQQNGGLITLQDLRTYRTIRRAPLRGTYRGFEVVVPPPACSGGTHLLQMLNLLEGFNVSARGFGTPEMLHLLAESMKIAFADRFRYMGDPESVGMPVEWLTSKGYAAERRDQIDLKRAGTYAAGVPGSRESGNTTHLTSADAAGNVVAMTQTINEAFGSRVTVPGTGMLLNNNMQMFDPHPGHPNSIRPGARQTSSMCPTIVQRDGEPFLAIGTPGGTRIFPSILQAISNVIDHGMTLQEAVEAPRAWTQGQDFEVEEAIPESVRSQLRSMGHSVTALPRVAGGMNGILFDRAGVMTGAACWRADGAPVGISGGPARPGARFGMSAR